MRKRLDHLTPEQEALLPAIRDEWVAHGLSTAPADRPAAETAARLAYEKAGLPVPRFVVWLRSPLEGVIGAAMLTRAQVGDQVGDQVRAQVGDQVGDQVRDQVWDQVGAQVRAQVGDQVRAQVWDQVGAQVWDQVGDQVGDQVRAQVWDQVRAQVGDQVGDQVWDQVGDQVRAQVWDQVWQSLWGQHDAGWLAWLDTFGRLGIDTSLAAGLIGVGRNAGWWWAFRDAVILTERPLVLRRDERGRLHREDGPAIVYPDGFGIWAWHGVRVSADIIEYPDTITVEAIDAEANAEIARVMVERYGLDRFLRDGKAKAVGRDDWGTLWRRPMKGADPLVLVEVLNSTPEPDGSTKTYFLRVPPGFGGTTKSIRVAFDDDARGDVRTVARTPHAAIAWTFGLTPDEYRPAVMT